MGKQTLRQPTRPSAPLDRRAAAIRPRGLSRTTAAVCVLLPMLVAVVFIQTVGFPFANLDDNEYVYENPYLTDGLTGPGIVWAFTEMHRAGHWHPLTWLSLMLDSQLYTPAHSGGFPLTNVLLHAANSVILLGFALLQAGRLDESIAHLQKALELKPDFVEARRSLELAKLQLKGGAPALSPKFEMSRPDRDAAHGK